MELMKVSVHLREPVNGNLRNDNIRGEARWERQALEAFLENAEVTDVYSTGHLWRNSTHPKYRGVVPADSTDIIYVGHDWNVSAMGHINWKAILVNIFAGPWQEQKDQVQALSNRYGNKLIFTIGYSALLDTQKAYLKQFIPEENILCLPVPGAYQVSKSNGFDNRILLWPYRVLVLSAIYKAKSIRWALEQLAQDSTLNLKIVTSWSPSEIRDLCGDESVIITEDLSNYFWSRDETKDLSSVRDRVEIRNSQTHQQMLDLYAHTKLVLPHYRYFGGPGVEAAMYGVPFVGNMKMGAFTELDEYLFTNSEDEQLVVFNRLMTDKDFYTDIATKYRDYVDRTYSINAFNNNFNRIIRERNI